MQTQPFFILGCWHQQSSKLAKDLDVIGSWVCNKNLFLNVTKTEAMLFGTQAKLFQVINFCDIQCKSD